MPLAIAVRLIGSDFTGSLWIGVLLVQMPLMALALWLMFGIGHATHRARGAPGAVCMGVLTV